MLVNPKPKANKRRLRLTLLIPSYKWNLNHFPWCNNWTKALRPCWFNLQWKSPRYLRCTKFTGDLSENNALRAWPVSNGVELRWNCYALKRHTTPKVQPPRESEVFWKLHLIRLFWISLHEKILYPLDIKITVLSFVLRYVAFL